MKALKLPSFFLILVLSSCYQEHYPTPASTKELIAGFDEFGKTYQVNHITIEIGTVTPHPCVTDNYITYFPNGRYEINEGSSKCDPNDPPSMEGFWSINRAETLLFVEIGETTQVWEIESIGYSSHEITSSFKEGLRTYTFNSSN